MNVLTLQNAHLTLVLNPAVGGTITTIRHRGSGLSVLGAVHWPVEHTALPSGAARDEPEWLTRYTGGWPLLFPNGGDACTFKGVFHGFHGEASISPWEVVSASDARVMLQRSFVTVPVAMTREIALVGDEVIVREAVHMQGKEAIEVMWGHHPTFGSDLLAGPFEITSGAGRVSTDDAYDPAANPLRPGESGTLSALPGKLGPCDMARPHEPLAALLYLEDFTEAWAAVRRLDNAIAVRLSWDARQFPLAWLWYELRGTSAPPWDGRTTLIGIEPNTTKPAYGLACAAARGGSLLRLEPGSRHATELRLKVFVP